MLYKRPAEKFVRKGGERERPFNVSSEAKKEDRPIVYLHVMFKGNRSTAVVGKEIIRAKEKFKSTNRLDLHSI
jgi:hypothetical protein